MQGPKLQDLIHRYVMGRLSASEKEEFEGQMAADPELSTKVILQEEAYKLAKKAGPVHLKEQLQAMEKEKTISQQVKPVRRIPARRVWLLAASLAVLILAAWWIVNSNTGPTTDTLMAEYMQPYRSPANLRGEANSVLLRSQAAELYDQKDYAQSALLWERLLTVEGGGTASDHFYLGVSLLFAGTDKTDRAIDQLKQLLAGENDYHQQSLWFIALAYLKDDNQEEARVYLKKLVDTGEYKKKEAQALLRSMMKE